jgi:anti-anti-sigma regulatory factor
MYSVEADRGKRLLVISASGHVSKEEVKAAAQKVGELVKDAEGGLRALTDLRWLTSMDSGAAEHIAEIMDTLREKGLASVTRVMPDPRKDIGFNILSQFHYGSKVKIYTFETLAEAIQSLVEEK